MCASVDRRLAEHRRLGAALGDAIVRRGVLQHFFVSPVLPMEPLCPQALGEAWRRLAEGSRGGSAAELLHLYLHIPFCVHRCRYCVYYSIGGSDGRLQRAYLRRLHEEIDFYAERAAGLEIDTCYLGGGTPTILAEPELEGLLDHLGSAFTRRRGGEWAFECNPLTLTAAKAAVLRDHGFNRASFGVQTLNQEVLRGVNRGYQSHPAVAEAFRILSANQLWINVDLIFGLPGEAPGSMLHSLAAILELGPTQVTIYAINPYTPLALDTSELEPLAAWVERLTPLAAGRGYQISASSTCIGLTRQCGPDDNLLSREHARGRRKANYDDTTVEPCSLLGIGPTARSYVYGQLRATYDPYPVDTPFDAAAPCATGRAISPAEERHRYAVYQLEHPQGLGRQGYEDVFGEPWEDCFGTVPEQLVSHRLLREEQGILHHTTADLAERFAVELFFVEPLMIAAAWRQVESPGGGPSEAGSAPAAAGGPKQGTVFVAVEELRLQVILTRHRPGRGCYEHHRGFSFYLPSDQPDGKAQLSPRERRLAEVFSRLFRRVIQRLEPQTIGQLQDWLIAEARRHRGLVITRA